MFDYFFCKKDVILDCFCVCRGDKTRTCGLYVPNVARYQLRHTPLYALKLDKSNKKKEKATRKKEKGEIYITFVALIN